MEDQINSNTRYQNNDMQFDKNERFPEEEKKYSDDQGYNDLRVNPNTIK